MAKWTKEELDKLTKIYSESETIDNVIKQLSGRTKGSIIGKAERLKLVLKGARTEWLDEEKESLKELYEDCGKVENISHLFPGRTIVAISKQAASLGLSVISWTDEEKKILNENFSILPNSVLEKLLPGKTYRAITVKASRLGLKKNPELRSYMQTKENNHFFGHSHSEETKAKMSYRSNAGRERLADLAMIKGNFGNDCIYQLKSGESVELDSIYEVRLVTAFDKFGFEWKKNVTQYRVSWTDSDNKGHFYFPDLILNIDDHEYIIEVKGKIYSESPKTRAARRLWEGKYFLVGLKEIEHFERHGWFF